MNTLKYVALPCGILLLLTVTLFASDAELTATEIRARVIGNTVVGVEDGKYYEEYLQPNGIIAGRSRQETYRGWWRIDANKLCFAYETDDEDASKDWDCNTVSLNGDRVTWDGEEHARLVPGRLLSSMRTTAAKPAPQQASKKPN
ncbi:hypothetical protein G3545_08780 [Starkeya sp. ORNL1]|uniref:hypothetical protein n=1 Tax=Starkeya sp. ORNL1 TaxID=2709380 RepID=UPI00146366C3|nr:hypothetical protein [Starkeya sp. ORNL1]QJP13743.1 hypothetical protein G3545_08780 [Starkeya sp. ORNL1]